METPVRRDTARVILIGPGDRVLLFKHPLPEPWAQQGWLTPGGAIEPAESPADAAARELLEETGHALAPTEARNAVAFDSGQWSANGTVFATVNWYFFARVTSDQVDLSGQDDYELEELLDHRWWTITDLELTRDLVFPIGLAGLLPRLLANDLPTDPVRLPWT